MRLTFHNAMIYNPATNHVHANAKAIGEEFEDEIKKLAKKVSRDEKRRIEHSCGLCQGKTCKLCGEKVRASRGRRGGCEARGVMM